MKVVAAIIKPFKLDDAASTASRLVAAGRHIDRSFATVNLPVTRAASVLFE